MSDRKDRRFARGRRIVRDLRKVEEVIVTRGDDVFALINDYGHALHIAVNLMIRGQKKSMRVTFTTSMFDKKHGVDWMVKCADMMIANARSLNTEPALEMNLVASE